MIRSNNELPAERQEQLERILDAADTAVRAALRRHMLLGESVAVSDGNGGVKILGPEEIRRVLEQGHD